MTNQSPGNDLEEWKEINANIRHWETLLFGITKDFLSVIAFAFGAAGAALVWPGVQWELRRYAITVFLCAAIAIATCAVIALLSLRSYLKGFYSRRSEIKTFRLREHVGGSGWTVTSLMLVFFVLILGSLILLIAVPEKLRPTLANAQLQGADLSLVEGLVQFDFERACGDANSKLPPGISLAACK